MGELPCRSLHPVLPDFGSGDEAGNLHPAACPRGRPLYPSPLAARRLRRDEVASCSERAYASLTVADAQALLMLGSQAEAEAYAKQVRSPLLSSPSFGWCQRCL